MNQLLSNTLVKCLMTRIVSSVFSSLTELKWLAVTAGMIGVSIGIFITMPNLLIVKYMGIENQPATRGVTSISVGFTFLAFGFVIGKYHIFLQLN